MHSFIPHFLDSENAFHFHEIPKKGGNIRRIGTHFGSVEQNNKASKCLNKNETPEPH